MLVSNTFVQVAQNGDELQAKDLKRGDCIFDPLAQRSVPVEMLLTRLIDVSKITEMTPVRLFKRSFSERYPTRDVEVSPKQQVFCATRNRSPHRTASVELVQADEVDIQINHDKSPTATVYEYAVIVTEPRAMMVCSGLILPTVTSDDIIQMRSPKVSRDGFGLPSHTKLRQEAIRVRGGEVRHRGKRVNHS